MSVIDFFHNFDLKNKATSNIKVRNILSFLYLNEVGISLRDGFFEFDVGIVSLHLSQETHWLAYTNENFFDSYG